MQSVYMQQMVHQNHHSIHQPLFMKKVLPFLCLVLFVAGCRQEFLSENDLPNRPAYTYSGQKVRNYFTLLCKISKTTPGFFPPQVARAYGYVGIANFEAVVHGIPGAQSLAGNLNGLSISDMPKTVPYAEYDWNIASNAALADIIRKMFETNITAANLSVLDSTERANLAEMSLAVRPEIVSRSVQFGKDVAKAIYQYSIADGGHRSYIDPFQLPYSMPPDPSCWIPTGAITTPIAPKWGENRPFIQVNISTTQNFTPLAFSTSTSSTFYKEAKDVYNQVRSNTPDQIEITKYWADDPFNTCTPTGHTFNIMTQLLEETKATLEKTSVAYAKLAIAESDAFVACWKSKYKYILIRPVSYIKQNIDPSFNTVIGTPPFPAFTSGHSAEIAAGSKIFIDMFTNGSGNYNFTDYSQLQFGFAARSYTNFNAMAEECADSRFYGGIHYKMDNDKGLDQGRIIGDNVNSMRNFPKNLR